MAKERCPITRGTHAKGSCARAEFEVFDVTSGRDAVSGARLAMGIFAKPGKYPAVVRFGNSDPNRNSDFKPDVRSLSFSVDLGAGFGDGCARQDFSLQNAATLPINDATGFLAISKVLIAKSPGAGLKSLAFRDKLRVIRTLILVQLQSHKSVRAYQQLRYWSTVPFHHGQVDFVMQSAVPAADNPAGAIKKGDPDGLQKELTRHLNENSGMSSFDFRLQFLDTAKMTYWGKRWIRISGSKTRVSAGMNRRHRSTRSGGSRFYRSRRLLARMRTRCISMLPGTRVWIVRLREV